MEHGFQGFSKVVKIAYVAAISNRALSSAVRTRLGNRGYIRDFGKVLTWIYRINRIETDPQNGNPVHPVYPCSFLLALTICGAMLFALGLVASPGLDEGDCQDDQGCGNKPFHHNDKGGQGGVIGRV
jgi:hypothetical protein